jgi:CRP/FNR family transcriptional regulator
LTIKEAIESIDFFSSLSESAITQLVSFSTLHSYSKNYIINYERRDSNQLLFLVKGVAKAYKIDKHSNEIFLYYIYNNSMLSEISDINTKTLHTFSNLETIEESVILSVDYPKFQKYFLHNNLLCLEFANEVIKHSRELQTLISREFLFDSVAKVAMMIFSDLEMFNKLKRHETSLILHIQPATLSRVLTRLKRNKIIDIIQGKIFILDEIALVAIFEDS